MSRKLHNPVLTVLAAALCTTTAAPALAAWPHAPGVNLAVCTAANNQQGLATASDGSGGSFVVWFDSRNGGDLDIYAHHLLATGGLDPAWPANGRAVCTVFGIQFSPKVVSDGSTGAIITWEDYRGANLDIYAQHVLGSGVLDPAWPANGRALTTAAGDQGTTSIASDGAGGAIVAWEDDLLGPGASDVYAQRVLASGVVDPAWPVNGRALCTAANAQNFPVVVSDGAGGAIVGWQDFRGGATPDVYAQHVRASGTVDPDWTANGSVVCAAANYQESIRVISDGVGGAIFTWSDLRSGVNYDLYAQHMFATGYVDGVWPLDGRAICTASGSQSSPALVSDGSGGAIITWADTRSVGNADVYAQHVLATGAVDAGWPADGRGICNAAADQYEPAITSDGAGGAIVCWHDARNGGTNHDIFAQRVMPSGAVDPVWPLNGRALSTATNFQQSPVLAGDGAGAAIAAWVDTRTGGFDIFAQRVARHGVLGAPEPVIASVKDVPNDQGGKVKLSWDASWLDTDPSAVVDHYWIFRSVPTASALAAIRGGARLLAAPTAARGGRELFATTEGTNTLYWEFVANQQAFHFLSGYSVVTPTTGDSTGAYNPSTQFMVVAFNAAATQYWLSAAAGGYSVDNLPPGTPEPFLGNYAGGATHMHWEPNGETDFAHYRLYRGSSAAFVPGPGTLVASPPDTGYADAGAAGSFYKLSAVDSHGNESGFALLTPGGTTAVAPAGGVELALAKPFPNPSRGDVTFAVSLPAEGRVSLAVFDAAGRRVRRLFAGVAPAGVRTFTWNGGGESGQAVAGGLYFLRVEAAGRVLVRRIARVE